MKNKKKSLLLLLIVFNIVAALVFFDLQAEEEMMVVFLDVGQGDATLIRTPDRRTVLIDGGPDESVLAGLNEYLPFWDRNIDLMILSHAHADHLYGLAEVMERYNVEKVLWNGQETDTLVYRRWKSLLNNTDSEKTHKGHRIHLGEVHLDVLHPPRDYQFPEGLNEGSVVTRLVHESGAVLIMGDAYKNQEMKLMEKERECMEADYGWCRVMKLPSEVLRTGHHGSSTSTGYEFTERVSPETAVISAGKDNRYGHPHEETIATLRSLDVEIHETAKDGDLKVIFD